MKKNNVATLMSVLLHREKLPDRGETEQGDFLTVGRLQRHLCDYFFFTLFCKDETVIM